MTARSGHCDVPARARGEMRRAAARAVPAALAVLVPAAARADTPMSYLRTFSPKGDQITTLTWALLAQSVIVVVIISILVLLGVLNRRSGWTYDEVQRQTIGPAAGGLRWIYIGVALTAVALLVSMVWTATTMANISRPPSEPTLTIEVTGHQWWWQVRYLGDDPSQVFETANEIHIPVGEPIRVRLVAADVIHSFWIPALGGKTDIVPGQTNVTWIQASKPGIYRGQCGEYCGPQHAHMALLVFADTPENFAAWRNAQLQPAPAPTSVAVEQGQNDFTMRCGACHTVRGTRAQGNLGPDLTHLMSRTTIAAGTLPNKIGYLSGWIANPQGIKPEALMPTLGISGQELASIRKFLETLK